MRWLGAIVVAGAAVHSIYHLRHGRPWDLLWMCHIGSFAVGIGLVMGWGQVVTIGVLWLSLGLPLWLLDLAAGGEFMPTSLLTHVGGLVAGVIGLYKNGMSGTAWWKAMLALVALQQVCRWVTPRSANVNLAFDIHPGWERHFGSYRWYWIVLTALCAVMFFGVEQGLRFLASRPASHLEEASRSP